VLEEAGVLGGIPRRQANVVLTGEQQLRGRDDLVSRAFDFRHPSIFGLAR
jgi:hypothetical protein